MCASWTFLWMPTRPSSTERLDSRGAFLNMGGGPRFTLSLLELLAILEKGLEQKISVS